jgi:hypothetical protein
MILAECQRKQWPLLIADDRSTDSQTLEQLEAAVLLGATLVRRDYQRTVDANAHEMLQRNALFGFQEAISRWPNNECILKLDDDIVLACGAFQKMQRGGHERS